MTDKDGKTATPRLRFPEFRGTGKWQLTPGDRLFDAINNRDCTSELPILAITQDQGAIPRDQIDYHVSVTEKSIESYKVVAQGDFIISLRSFQGGIEYSYFHGICSPAYIILRRKVKGSDHYFKHLFKSQRFIQQLTRNIEGLRDGKMISFIQFSEQLIPTPHPGEQQKIAACLTSQDELIAAQGRKVEALKEHKRGLLQKLFPREGETTPRLRFPEFRDGPEWEEITIGDMGEVITGSTPSTAHREFYSGEYLLVSPGDISEMRLIQSTKTTLTAEGFTQCRPIKAWSVMVVCIGSTIGKVAQNIRECATNQQINSVVPNPLFSGDFIYYLFLKESEKIKKLAGKQAVPIINKTLFSSVKVVSPKLSEQQRIASCLSSLDSRIAAESEKLEALKSHKKSLMQQLFPSPEETQ